MSGCQDCGGRRGAGGAERATGGVLAVMDCPVS